jgi:DNA-binding NarL/FixJ family response regulator
MNQSSSEELKTKSKVLLVDDHPIVRKGLGQLINQEPGLEICGEAEDAPQALKAIGMLKPHIVVLDLLLKGTNGLELLKVLKTRFPKIPVLVLSMYDESLYAERALRAGAKGYLMKQEGTEKVICAIRKILSGEVCVSENLASQMLSRIAEGKEEGERSPIERLSDRELEVFQSIGNGLTTRQIAEKLSISIKTVESYREHLKEKLKLKNGTELVRHAVQFFHTDKSEL